jgi:hypothetical protein
MVEALGAVTKIAREAMALPLGLWSEALHGKGLGGKRRSTRCQGK